MTNKQMLMLALFQVTAKGEVYSMKEIKEMSMKTLQEQFNYFSKLKTQNSRRITRQINVTWHYYQASVINLDYDIQQNKDEPLVCW